MRRPDFAEIERIRQTLQRYSDPMVEGCLPRYAWVGDWRGQYQIDMMQMQLEPRTCPDEDTGAQIPCGNVSVQKAIPQESGKTFTSGLHTCARLLDGQNGVWCYPTLRQGARVAVNRVDQWMRVLEKEHGVKRVMPDAAYEKRWENGAGLMVLSLDVSAKSGVQGYTIEFGGLDEAHEILQVKEVVGGIFSRFSIAMRTQDNGEAPFAWINVMGVGGPKDCLINYCRDKMRTDSKYAQWDWRAVQRDYPLAKQSIDWARRNYPLTQWEQFYELKDVAVGMRRLFPVLLEQTLRMDTPPQYSIGIDVGKNTDFTVAMLLNVGASSVLEQTRTKDIADVFTVPHGLTNDEQARAIVEWARPYLPRVIPGCKTVETNSIGESLRQALEEYWPDVGGLDITDNARNLGKKSILINEVRIDAQNACLGVPHIPLNDRGEDAHEHFAGLTFDLDEKGQATWEHSDYLSALLMCYVGL